MFLSAIVLLFLFVPLIRPLIIILVILYTNCFYLGLDPQMLLAVSMACRWLRSGLNPKLLSENIGSSIGSMTILIAVCKSLSRTVGTPSSLTPLLFGLGISTRRTGIGL